MAKKPLTLTCEACGKKFEAGARRKIVRCRECAEEIRHRGLGPVQIKKRPVTSPFFSKPIIKEIAWEHADRDLSYYLARFNRYRVYDGVIPSDLDKVTDEDRRMANQIAARMSANTWAQIVGQSIAPIGNWDLLRMTDLEWQRRAEVIHEVLGGLLEHPGIGVARITKGLHRKRPNLIPVCDSVVLDAMGVGAGHKADRVTICMERLRSIGCQQIHRLTELRQISRQHEAEMSELRILELLYWVQFGPFTSAN